jgi:DNA-binding transcriptional LysR family regulator
VPSRALADQPILRREASSGTQELVDRALARAGANPPTLLVLGSTEALKQAVLADVGMAWLPRLAVMHELARGELKRVVVDGLEISRTLSLIHLHGVHLSAAADGLVAGVQRALQPEYISGNDG